MAGANSERVLVLTPSGRDSNVAVQLLQHAGFAGHVCADLPALCREIERGAGLSILAEEATINADLSALSQLLAAQPPWSDVPFVLLTHHGGGPERNPPAARVAEILGNVTFLERPFHPTTLVSVVRTALRGRRRQYEARTHLMELDTERRALSALTATLEQNVDERTSELFSEVAAKERAQAQLLQSQKVESLGQLTGGVAHDFNNLLMAVMGNLDLLRKRFAKDERASRLIDSAMQGATRGAVLTQRMLAFARQQDLKTKPTDLAALLTGMRGLIERALTPAIELAIDVPLGLPMAQVDPNQIELAVLNLCINARDAMPKGGKITVALDSHSATDGLKSGQYLRVCVIDSGSGMDEATLKKAVDPFFSTKPIGKGTGLGLSTVHGLATQLGGRFDLHSTPGKGTTATLWLPQAAENVGAPALAVHAPLPEGTKFEGATILVVDDDALIAMSTLDMLEDLGYKVVAAHSGERALEIIDEGVHFDLLMTDHAMPGMTGVELAAIVREKRPALPVLLATGYADIPDSVAANWPRLPKPYQQVQLQEHITRLLSRGVGW